MWGGDLLVCYWSSLCLCLVNLCAAGFGCFVMLVFLLTADITYVIIVVVILLLIFKFMPKDVSRSECLSLFCCYLFCHHL